MKTKYKIFIVIGIFLLIGIISNTDTSDLESKTSDYTQRDCLSVCENSYNIQIQSSICKNNCYYYKTNTKELDRYVESIKKLTHKRKQQLNNTGGK